MRLRRLAVPALVLLPAVLLAAGPASAAGGLVPGGSETISVPLPAAWAAQADRLGVSVIDLAQDENRCLEPERKAGDRTCGADQGDLAGQLLAEVSAGTLVEGACRAAGDAVPLDLLHAGAKALLPVSGAGCLAVRLSFPNGADDNVAQSDTIAFRLRTVAEGPDGGTAGADGAVGTAAGGPVRDRGPGAGPGPGAGRGTVLETGRSGTVLGEQTTPVRVGGDAVSLRTKASATSSGGLMPAWGSLFLGVVLLGLAVFLWWSRRRHREAS